MRTSHNNNCYQKSFDEKTIKKIILKKKNYQLLQKKLFYF